MQANAENEQDKAEVLQEVENRGGAGKTEMASHDATKQDECDSKGYAPNLQLAQHYAYGNNDAVKQDNMGNGVLSGK